LKGRTFRFQCSYRWISHNAGFGFLDFPAAVQWVKITF
jgi:hypothetical protein